MPSVSWFDRIPLWGVLAGTIALIFASFEAARRWTMRRRTDDLAHLEGPSASMSGAALGLLAFMLAFTFGMAGARFERRRDVLLEEANAIGTAYLRAELLPAAQTAIVRKLLREYVDLRIAAPGLGMDGLRKAIERSEQIHGLLWREAVASAQANPGSIPTGLFIQSLNELIDLHSKRLTASLRSRIPGVIWAALYILTILSMAMLGYQAGLFHTRLSVGTLILAAAFSAVLCLIADLERPQEGLLRVGQQALIDARAGMKEAPSP
jgi:hypothetical protein